MECDVLQATAVCCHSRCITCNELHGLAQHSCLTTSLQSREGPATPATPCPHRDLQSGLPCHWDCSFGLSFLCHSMQSAPQSRCPGSWGQAWPPPQQRGMLSGGAPNPLVSEPSASRPDSTARPTSAKWRVKVGKTVPRRSACSTWGAPPKQVSWNLGSGPRLSCRPWESA